MKQLKACVSKLCRATCRVVVEVVVAKLDNWRRLFSGKAKFGQNRKNGFGRLQSNNQIKSSIAAAFYLYDMEYVVFCVPFIGSPLYFPVLFYSDLHLYQ